MRRIFVSRPLLLVGLLLPLLALPACGRRAKIVVVSGAEAGTVPSAEVVASAEEQQLGLWDPSPIRGDEVQGQVTYAFRPASDPTPKRGGFVRAALLEDIDSFNPYLSSSASASEVQDQIFPRLMYEQPNYYDGVPTFTPQIAESWEIAPDNLSIRFRLRDCNWSDGTPMTSADIRFSWEAARNPDVAWVSSSIVDFIKDVEIHSDKEFTVHYTKAQPYNIMDINDVTIVPKHTFGKVPFGQWSGYGEWAELANQAAGGPWMLERHDPGQEIVLQRNPEFWDEGKPYLERLIFKIFGNMGSMLNALLAGQLDIMNGIQPDQAQRVVDDRDLFLYTYVARSYGYVGWNCKRFPFDDRLVRQAMTYAINRFDIVEGQFYGFATVAGPNLLRSIWASDRSLEPYPYDPARAEQLLVEAGWVKNDDDIYEKDGREFRFRLITNSGNPTRKAMCERIQADLRKIGVRAEIRLVDFNQMSQQLKQHDFQAYVGGWYIATKVDPKPTFHSVSANGRYNYVNYTNPFVDELIDRGRVMNISDPTIRKEAMIVWRAFQIVLYDDQPYTMLYEPRGLVGLSKQFVNVRVTSLRWLDNVHEWWIE
ncbi:MAG: ABC transporter substrate-binding protein [Planctomycetota bacterium]|jgi:peptide/nickel transport system substrate-binding protein